MDEVDGIIIRTLKSIGCELQEDIKSVGQMRAESVVEAAALCIRRVDPSIQIHHRLPPNMAARYRIGTNLADAIKGFGYQGEVGYHTFLYSNEFEVRKIFLFLIEKLPKSHTDVRHEPLSPQLLLKRSIKEAMKRSLQKPWIPLFFVKDSMKCQPFDSQRLLLPFQCVDTKQTNTSSIQKYYSHHLPLLSKQLKDNKLQLNSSILEMNSLKLSRQNDSSRDSPAGMIRDNKLSQQESIQAKRDEIRSNLAQQLKLLSTQHEKSNKMRGMSSSALLLSGKLTASRLNIYDHRSLEDVSTTPVVFDDEPEESTVSLVQKEKEEMEALEGEVGNLSHEVDETESEIVEISARIEQVTTNINSMTEENKKKKEALKTKEKLLSLLPDSKENLAKLKEMAETSSQRLDNMTVQWQAHKKKMLDEYEQLLLENQANEIQSREKKEELNDIKMKIKQLTSQASDKEALSRQLLADYENMSDGLSRSTYTQRILEIVANIKKQNQEIDKVIVDTKSVQKEINQLSGVVERTFIDTDELIFKTAKKDETSRRAYKLLASLHENCGLLVKSVDEMGTIMKETRDLEEQLELESNVNITESLDKILSDYHQIKQENQMLLQKLKRKVSTS